MKQFVCVVIAMSIVGCGGGDGGNTPPQGELIVNGSFETPDAPMGTGSGGLGGWTIYTEAIYGWSPANANGFEIIDRLIDGEGNVWQGFDGYQFVELDASANGGIYQLVNTIPGETYFLSYRVSPRPGLSWESCTLEIYIDDVLRHTVFMSGTGRAVPSWNYVYSEIVATGPTTKIAFMAAGTSDGMGAFIDNVSMVPIDQAPF